MFHTRWLTSSGILVEWAITNRDGLRMNGFTAADMSTAAANGFRDGLAAQPAAAQEAVAWQVGDEFYTSESLAIEGIQQWGPSGAIAIPLYAAPVAAAPVDAEELARNRYRPVPDGLIAYRVVAGDGTRSLFSGTKDACNIVARKLTEAFLDGAYVASTPAAPGIDLAQFKDLIGFAAWSAINLPETDPRRDFIRQASELLALIDASPKGGSDTQDAAFGPRGGASQSPGSA